MKNLNLKRRIVSAAAAAVMSVSAIGGSVAGTAYVAVNNANVLSSLAANSSVVFTESAGYAEGAYAEWAPVSNATGYNVYCDGVQIDSMLIRQYSGYFRADAVGLKAGSHTIKVVPVISGSEDTSKAASVNVTSTSYDREGFCFSSSSVTGGSGLGAYNDDGTLKSNAVVLYVTEETKNTVTMDVQTAASKTTSCTGIGAILKAMQKGYETRPVAIRIIGKVTADGVTTSGDTNNLLLKASATDSPIQNVTVEGIGEDAVCYGFGVRCQRARSIEIRNLAIMLFGDDGIALETDNYNIWVHNNDIFYGTAGSDADQAKGDGSMDLKNDSKYITISYNHFWDSGKMSLCGMKSETGENFISYHHNWFDHSDSRHPRIRTMSVHVYNNYYDGNSKYGVGVTMGASAFVESNYFRNCQYPMMSSKQGTDALGDGTFSGENGGVIKAYGNIMEGQKSYITYAQDNTQFDAYEVSNPKDTVPSSVKAASGGTSYDNFDTASTMYKYTPDAAADVPSIVMSQAGRVNGGDFEWEFNDSVDDTDYSVNKELMAAITSYKSPVIAIGSGFKSDTGSTTPVVTTTVTTAKPSASTTTTKTETPSTPSTPSVAGSYIHNFTENGDSSTFYTINGVLSSSKGTVNYDGKTLTKCLKLESTTSITFTGSGTLTLVLSESGKAVKIDGTKYTSDANGIVTATLSAGTHTITKGDVANLFYMVFSGEGSSTPVTTTTVAGTPSTPSTTVTTKPIVSDDDVIPTDIKLVSAGGWNEMMYMVLSGVKDADVKSVSYSGPASGTLTGTDFEYLVRDTDQGVRVDVVGLKPGTYSLTMETSKGKIVKNDIAVGAQDRSGYAHFNYTAGVGAYNDDGTLKSNAVVLYVTEDNKNTVSVTSKDGTTVKGIGNILNSAGQDNGSGKTSKGGTPNTNSDIIEKLAKDGTPLVIRIIGNVSAPEGVTAYDSINYGGSVGDNGYMARMQSGKDVTIEGIGTDATINGWGIHFIAETGNTSAGKSFEVRNIAFRNVPEDCLGMEGQQGDDSLTAPVERCWIHNCEFYAPKISNPAESDKDGGDGACDFKRGQYFTNSYCYYEGYHKTNLVGSSDTSLQYHLTYHHNYWKNCESRGPLARQADIHMYNNVYDGQTSYCQNPRANAFIFSEYNYFVGCKDICEVTSGGVVKSYMDTVENCRGNAQATVVTDKSKTVSSSCKYANFDTNSSVSYVPSGKYSLDTDTSILKSEFETEGGCMDEMSISSGDIVITPTPGQTTTTTTVTTTTTTTTTPTPATTTTTTTLKPVVTTTTTTPKPVATTTTTVEVPVTPPATTTTDNGGDTSDVVYGDADGDGEVTIADVVAIMVHMTTPGGTLTSEQIKNADVYQRGDGISNMDALAVQKKIAQLIASLPESYMS